MKIKKIFWTPYPLSIFGQGMAIIKWSFIGSVQNTSLKNGLIISRSSENG